MPDIGVALYAAFGPATTPELWPNVAGGCTGIEPDLYDCPLSPTAVSCASNNAAGVRCYSPCKCTLYTWLVHAYVHVHYNGYSLHKN